MDQTIIENGNNVENYVYKNRVASSMEEIKGQMNRKFATEGKIIGKGNYEFYIDDDGKLRQVVPQNLHKPLKRIMKTLESEGLISSTSMEEENTSESTLVAEVATM